VTLRTAAQIIEELGLIPHPEGGYYREIFRSTTRVSHPGIPDGESNDRAASTSIYFLLESGDFSAFHRVRSDETWHLHGGGPLEIHLIDQHGAHTLHILGLDVGAGFQPQLTIPANVWQACRPAPAAEYVLCGCQVAPGFEFADFSLASRRELIMCYPGCEAVIEALTRD